jgi:copper chaperone CopZ
MRKVTMEITGMSCGHCVASVTKTLEALDGVAESRVEIGSAAVEFDPDRITLPQMAQAIADEGYVVVGTH